MIDLSCSRHRGIQAFGRRWSLTCATLIIFGLLLAGGSLVAAQAPQPSPAIPVDTPTPRPFLQDLLDVRSGPSLRAMYITFYAALFVSIVGIGVMIRRIVVVRRRRGERQGATVVHGDVLSEEGRLPSGLHAEWDAEQVPDTSPAQTSVDSARGSAEASAASPALLPPSRLPGLASVAAPVDVASSGKPLDAAEQLDVSDSGGIDMQQRALQNWLRRATSEDVEELMGEGMRLATGQRKAEAYDVFSAVTRLKPDHVSAWLWKAGTALHPQESVRCLQKALELDPENSRAIEGLAWALAKLAEHEEGELGPLPD